MWFGYNPQTIFDTCSQVELNLFQALITIKVNRYWVLCVRNNSYIVFPGCDFRHFLSSMSIYRWYHVCATTSTVLYRTFRNFECAYLLWRCL